MRRVDIVDEPDLYPPDVERLTPELRHQRNRAILGVGLVTVGSGLLLDRMFNLHLDFWGLALGLGLLAGWVQVQRYGMFVAGSILTGFGLGSLFESAVDLRFESTLGWILAAAGFFAVYVRYPKRGRWAIVPAAILGVFSVADFGLGVIGLVPRHVTGVLLPLMLVTAGALLLFRHSLPRPLVKLGLIAAVIVFVSSATSGVGNFGAMNIGLGVHETQVPVPALAGRTLVFSTTSGDVDIQIGSVTEPVVVVRSRGQSRQLAPVLTPPSSATQLQLPVLFDGDYKATVPPGTAVKATTLSGDISATVSSFAAGAFSTTSGSIKIRVESMESFPPTSTSTSTSTSTDAASSDLSMTSLSGDVSLNEPKPASKPTVAVNTLSGDVKINGKDRDHNYTQEGTGRKISVKTASGDVRLAEV